MRLFFIICICCLASHGFAQSIRQPTPEQQRKFLANLTYAPLDFFIPSKLGLAVGWRVNPKTSVEMEYLRGSLSVPFLFDSLGGMTDQRISLFLRRQFTKLGFNYFLGFAHNVFRIRIGNEIVARAIPHSSEFDEMKLSSIGFLLGLGSRWYFEERFMLGFDWGLLAQPIIQIEKKTEFLDYVSDGDRGRFEDAIDFISDFPRLSFLKLHVGMTF